MHDRKHALASRLDHALRVVAALSLGSLGAARGCGATVSCRCALSDGGISMTSQSCLPSQEEAGCHTQVNPGRPLAPPELAC